jgi:NAD(P)-dependent dehydrogenase (short-subunit alcohol dehydrogenase family)
MVHQRWTAEDVPDQSGRTAVVTGANTGIGFEAALVLAQHGAEVVLACRNPAKAADAADRIRAVAPESKVSTLRLDLASQQAVREAASELRERYERIDLLVNNAGGIQPRHAVTEDGFELTFATNHLGPFAFTGLVLDRLLPVAGSRVVTVSSIGHRGGRLRFDDLQLTQAYRNSTAYLQSKLANLLFAYELQRRLAAAGAQTTALAAHPGNARTEFGRDMAAVVQVVMRPWAKPLTSWLFQDPPVAALGTVRAAVDPDARGGDYYGPPGRAQFTGYPERVESSARSHDAAAQKRLWEESERLTGVRYSLARLQA